MDLTVLGGDEGAQSKSVEFFLESEFNFGELWHANIHRWQIANCLDGADLWRRRWTENPKLEEVAVALV